MKINISLLKNNTPIFFILILFFLILNCIFFAPKNPILPGDVKLEELVFCTQTYGKWVEVSSFRKGDKVSICAELNSNGNPVEIEFIVFDEDNNQSVVYAGSEKFEDGPIFISLPGDLPIGKYNFKIKWGRFPLGNMFFEITN